MWKIRWIQCNRPALLTVIVCLGGEWSEPVEIGGVLELEQDLGLVWESAVERGEWCREGAEAVGGEWEACWIGLISDEDTC